MEVLTALIEATSVVGLVVYLAANDLTFGNRRGLIISIIVESAVNARCPRLPLEITHGRV
jgi:hypothetical protein